MMTTSDMQEIIQPVDKELIKAELTPEVKFRDTNKGGNEIYIVDWRNAPNTLREIGRLREVCFRAEGGSTGLAADLDDFDYLPEHPYHQMIVWDPEQEAILGGYRFIFGDEVLLQPDGQPYMTSSHLFHFSNWFIKEYLPVTVELGRSFVAPDYQSSKAGAKAIFAMDNLWDGIMSLPLIRPKMQYFFGKMTIYPSYDRTALSLVLHFLGKHFPDNDNLISPKAPYETGADGKLIDLLMDEEDFKPDYKILKKSVHRLGTSIPPLVNSYMNLSSTMKMFGTAVNDEMHDILDTGIMVAFDDIYDDKKSRHIDSYFVSKIKSIKQRFPRMSTDGMEHRLREHWKKRHEKVTLKPQKPKHEKNKKENQTS